MAKLASCGLGFLVDFVLTGLPCAAPALGATLVLVAVAVFICAFFLALKSRMIWEI